MKNIVICCDGTGNEISENISNVLKLYRTLRKTEKTTPRQMVFYDPGVGTLARPNPWKKLVQDASEQAIGNVRTVADAAEELSKSINEIGRASCRERV